MWKSGGRLCGQLRKQICETQFILFKLVILIIMIIINGYLNHCEVVPLDLYHHHLLDCNFLQVHRTTFLYVLQWPNMINTYINIKILNIYIITTIKYLPSFITFLLLFQLFEVGHQSLQLQLNPIFHIFFIYTNLPHLKSLYYILHLLFNFSFSIQSPY